MLLRQGYSPCQLVFYARFFQLARKLASHAKNMGSNPVSSTSYIFYLRGQFKGQNVWLRTTRYGFDSCTACHALLAQRKSSILIIYGSNKNSVRYYISCVGLSLTECVMPLQSSWIKQGTSNPSSCVRIAVGVPEDAGAQVKDMNVSNLGCIVS